MTEIKEPQAIASMELYLFDKNRHMVNIDNFEESKSSTEQCEMLDVLYNIFCECGGKTKRLKMVLNTILQENLQTDLKNSLKRKKS